MHELWTDFLSQMTPQMWGMLGKSTWETIYMGLMSTLVATWLVYRLAFWHF